MPKETCYAFKCHRRRKFLNSMDFSPIYFFFFFWDSMAKHHFFFHHKVSFFQFKTKFVFSNLSNTWARLFKKWSKDEPNTEKSSIKTFMNFSIISENIAIMHLWKVADTLHNQKNILRKAKVPYGQVKVVFSWSSGAMTI